MPFIYGISVKNFKVFNEKTTLSFSPLTVLTGANGSGKSTVNQAITLLKQRYNIPLIEFTSQLDHQFEINFREIIKPIPIDILDKRTATFKNLLNSNYKDNIIEFSIPSTIVDHGNTLEIVIRYRIHDNDLLPADLESFTLRDTDTDIPIFEIFREKGKNLQTSGYFSRINYKYFFNQFKEESSYYRKLMEVANDVLSVDDMDLIKNHPRRTELKEMLDKFYGSVLPDPIRGKTNNILIEHVNQEFIEEDFIEFRKSIDKRFRMLSDVVKKVPYDAEFFSFDQIITDDKQRFEFLSKLGEENEENIDFRLKYHSKILESLSHYKFSVADYYGPRATDIGYSIGIDEKMSYPLDPVYKLCTDDFNIHEYVGKKNKNHFMQDIAWKKLVNAIITDSGRVFFSKYVYKRIAKAIRNTMNFQFLNINYGKVDLSSSRLVDLTRNDGGSNTILEFISHSHEFSNSLKEFSNKWIKRFGIGDEINFNRHGVYTEVQIIKNGNVFNLSDEGLGVSKFIPILINVINLAHNSYDHPSGLILGSTLLLEEPEGGLHPALQSQLAEFFYDAYQKFNIQFIIETHSEYLIRKLQTMVVDESCKMKPEHVILYYFYHPDKVPVGNKQVFSIHIESDGSLSRNFGSGFFDESSNLNIALYNMTKVNRN